MELKDLGPPSPSCVPTNSTTLGKLFNPTRASVFSIEKWKEYFLLHRIFRRDQKRQYIRPRKLKIIIILGLQRPSCDDQPTPRMWIKVQISPPYISVHISDVYRYPCLPLSWCLLACLCMSVTPPMYRFPRNGEFTDQDLHPTLTPANFSRGKIMMLSSAGPPMLLLRCYRSRYSGIPPAHPPWSVASLQIFPIPLPRGT